jgi:short-subunit dehydrogenase
LKGGLDQTGPGEVASRKRPRLRKETIMLPENKHAVIYGAGGPIGAAVARAFARKGARVSLAGRTRAKLDELARDIAAASGNVADIAQVDALDEQAIQRHAGW